MRSVLTSVPRFVVALSLGALGSLPASAQIQTFWRLPGDGVWFDPNNWTDGATSTTSFPPPNSAGAWAAFGQQSGNPTRTITVDGAATVGRMTFTSSFGYTVTAGSLSLTNTGFNSSLIEKTGTGESTISSPITIGSVANSIAIVNGNTTGALTIASLAGSGSNVTINSYTGSGVAGSDGPGLVIIQSGTYGGGSSRTTVTSGVLRADEGVGLPSNTALNLNGGLWELGTATTITRTVGTAIGDIRFGGSSGFSAFNGPLTIRLNGGGTVQWGSTTFNPTVLRFGRGVTAGGNDRYLFENDLDLNGATRTIAVGSLSGIRGYLTLSGVLSNSSGTASGLLLTGGGTTIEMTGTNTYNGNTTVQNSAILRANEGAGLSPNTTVVLNTGILEGLGTTTMSRPLGTGPGALRVVGGFSGFSAFGGTYTVRLNNGTGTVTWGGADFNPTSALQFHSFNSDNLVDFQNGLNLNAGTGAARFITVRDNAASTTDVARISGVISNSAGAGILVVGGNGTLELSAANTYTGLTAISDSVALPNTVLKLVGTGSIANSAGIAVGSLRTFDVAGLSGGANFSAAANRFALAPGQTLSGVGTVAGAVLVGSGTTVRGGSPTTELNDPTGVLTFAGPLRVAGSGSLAVDLNGTATSGATVSRVAVTGAGNTFDINTANGPLTIRLLADQNLVLGNAYVFAIATSAAGFTRNETGVVSYTFGSDFTLASTQALAFDNVALNVSGNSLILSFVPVPVPEPASVLGLTALVALAATSIRRRRAAWRV